jgi:hypothetical protein
MQPTRLFLDTAFVQALLNRNDHYHPIAKSRLSQLRAATEGWTTEAILVEIGNALSSGNREAAVRFIHQCYVTPNTRVISVDTGLLPPFTLDLSPLTFPKCPSSSKSKTSANTTASASSQ